VQLQHGGSIVLDQTEALVAVDVNSGRYVSESSAEETAFKTNMEAAPEIARQIRLRDLGGVMVIDFIDMESEEHQHEVEQAFWDAMKGDRARIKMLHMSKFGIVEMTRQRMRESLGRTHYDVCPFCRGTGRIKTPERVGLDAFRQIRSRLQDKRIGQIEASLHPRVADYLQNEKRADLLRLEKDAGVKLDIVAAPDLPVDKVELVTYDKEGNRLKL
jgi:ribonuclease E